MRASFLIWLAAVAYALCASWAIDAYWRSNVTMKIVLFAPLIGGSLIWLFDDQL